MASGWNLWVWLQCIGVASQCCYKEVYNSDFCMRIIIIQIVLKLYMHTFYQQELPFHHMTLTRMVHHPSFL